MNSLETERAEYRNFLEQWTWELHATIQFGRTIKYEQAIKYAKQWLNSIKRKHSNIKFAGILFLSNPHGENPHIHILLTSDIRWGKTLTDLSPSSLEQMCKEDCKITTYRDWNNKINVKANGKTISEYVTKEKNLHLYDPDKSYIDVFRPDLLNKLKSGKVPAYA